MYLLKRNKRERERGELKLLHTHTRRRDYTDMKALKLLLLLHIAKKIRTTKHNKRVQQTKVYKKWSSG